MKKLILLVLVYLTFSTNSLYAQSIVNPTGDLEVTSIGIDLNATDIMLTNQQTGEVNVYINAKDFYAQLPSLSEGVYRVEYSVDGERYKTRFKLN